MKIFVVLACALALAAAKSRRHHHDLSHKASDYGEQVAYSGHAGHHGGVGVPVSQLVAHEDVQIGGYGAPLQLSHHGHGGNHYGGGGIKHSHAAIDYHGGGGGIKHSHAVIDYHGGGGGGGLGVGLGGGHGGGLGVGLGGGLGGGLALVGGPGGPSPAGLIGNPLDLPPEISKSVFVFSAPPDPSDLGPRTVISRVPFARPQKHYQVVFINAPTPPPPPQHKLELPPHPELKTLVYVLVKKPEHQKPIKVIKPLPRPPSKPEVYFIRYMNKHHHHLGHGEPHLGHGEPHLGHGEPPVSDIHHDYPVSDGPSHYGPPGGPLGEPMGPDYVDETYGHGAGSENRLRSLPPAERDAGVSGI